MPAVSKLYRQTKRWGIKKSNPLKTKPLENQATRKPSHSKTKPLENQAQASKSRIQAKLALALSCTFIDYPLPPGWTKRSAGIISRFSEFEPAPALTM
jgi:hypothetical protein